MHSNTITDTIYFCCFPSHFSCVKTYAISPINNAIANTTGNIYESLTSPKSIALKSRLIVPLIRFGKVVTKSAIDHPATYITFFIII